MSHHPRTIWGIVAFFLAIVVVGYVGVITFRGGFSALADSTVRCPMEEEECLNGDCANHEACKNGSCSSDCPGNCAGRVTE